TTRNPNCTAPWARKHSPRPPRTRSAVRTSSMFHSPPPISAGKSSRVPETSFIHLSQILHSFCSNTPRLALLPVLRYQAIVSAKENEFETAICRLRFESHLARCASPYFHPRQRRSWPG